MTAADKRRRAARGVGTMKMLTEAQDIIIAIRETPGLQLQELTRHGAAQVADLAALRLAQIEELPPHTGDTLLAAANLVAALGRAHAVQTSPEAWAGFPMLAEALQLLGAVDAQVANAQRLVKQRSTGRPLDPKSTAARIREADQAQPHASSQAIADKLGAEVDARQVRRVRARTPKA